MNFEINKIQKWKKEGMVQKEVAAQRFLQLHQLRKKVIDAWDGVETREY